MSTSPLGPSGDMPHIPDLNSKEKKPLSPLKKAKSSISGLIKSESFILTPSMRSLPVLALSAPLRIGSGLVKGISSMVKKGSIEAFTDTFSVEIGKLKLQAKGGISDYYRSLKPGNEKAKEIAANNYRYAGILNHQDWNEDFEEASWECTFIGETANESIDKDLQHAINNFVSNLKELGFKEAHMRGQPAFYDPETGVILKVAVDTEKKELVVAFFGFGNEAFLGKPPENNQKASPLDKEIKDQIRAACLKHIVLESLGEVVPGAKQAVKIGEFLKTCSEKTGLTPVVTGHSHGGGLAQCAAVTSEIKGVVFNSRPMGNGMRRRIGQNRIAKNASHVTAFSGKGDWLGRTRGINMMATFFERTTGIMVPRTVGKGYNLPKAHDDGKNIQHNLFQEQLKVILEGEE